jgi:hypothetical protein
VLDILRSAETTQNEILHSYIKGMGKGDAGNAVIPGLVSAMPGFWIFALSSPTSLRRQLRVAYTW